MKRVLDLMIDQGVDGICILANFSEQFLISDGERAAAFDGYARILPAVNHENRQCGFRSAKAVFGGEVPQPYNDHSALNPQISYGAQKAIGELLLNDYTRRGFVDGRGFRLPTISVRPGKPNRAASGFMSSILREPLQGQPANCPVDRDFPHFYLSPRKCVENLIKGAELAQADLGKNPTMTMPGRVWTIGQMIDAMTEVAGPEPAKLITWNPLPEIDEILKGWRMDLRPQKAARLGLEADKSFEENIRYFLEDDL